MKKMIVIVVGIIVTFTSCVSLNDRWMYGNEQSSTQGLDSVTATFYSFQFFHYVDEKKLKNKAYLALKKAAQDKYEGNIDIRNITIAGSGSLLSILPVLLVWYFGNVQKITATGDVVLVSEAAGASGTNRQGIDGALDKAAGILIDDMPRDSTIAILSVYSADSETSEYVIDELEYKFVGTRKFKIVDRRRLEQIRREQNFQLSGDVDDNSAVSIGNMLGATIVITGDISGSGSSRRLVLKAIDVKTAQIVIMARERF
ncbi:MAG: CsgG/HfaB family protein [Treponema sp.]|nr:CsgG/HfaB family protein [Treponema sp.]